jgi:homogentisate 1,2-dioxygenase
VGGFATDDPEGAQVLADVKAEAGDDGDIHILELPPTSHLEINALQRASTVILQKSLKEGFGLTVSEALWKGKPVIAIDKNIKALLLKGFEIKPVDDVLESRKILLLNSDCNIALAAPRKSQTDYFYKNADADEMIFVHKGSGVLKTFMGNIPFEYGDYLIIPRGMIYQMHFNTSENRLLYCESYAPYYTPKRYKNSQGQLLEHSPFCERDYKLPTSIETHDEKGDFLMKIKKEGMIHEVVYATHPFDVVGWDGYNFPWGFSIHNFEPITGRVHQPPPVHQTFETSTFVVCSFCPRLYDYHPQAIPAPYNHSNIDSDEVLYYVDGDFMSRNNIQKG